MCLQVSSTQAATCERCFSVITELKKHIGADVPPATLEQYLIVAETGPTTEQAWTSGFLKKVGETFSAKQRRQSFSTGSVYKKGRSMVQRQRAKRSDFGSKRKSYTRKAQIKGLLSLPNARLLRRLGSKIEEGGSPKARFSPKREAATPEILKPMSPRGKRGRALDSDEDE